MNKQNLDKIYNLEINKSTEISEKSKGTDGKTIGEKDYLLEKIIGIREN